MRRRAGIFVPATRRDEAENLGSGVRHKLVSFSPWKIDGLGYSAMAGGLEP